MDNPQMLRDEWNKYVGRKDPIPCKCELDECPYYDKERLHYHSLDCIDCRHYKEVQDE